MHFVSSYSSACSICFDYSWCMIRQRWEWKRYFKSSNPMLRVAVWSASGPRMRSPSRVGYVVLVIELLDFWLEFNMISIAAYPKCPIQIIMRLYRSPLEILIGFDVDECCVAYNGEYHSLWEFFIAEKMRLGYNVLTTPRGLTAILRQCNTIDLTRRSPSYEHRLAKYSDRGYEIFYPELNRNRIDFPRVST